MLALVALVLAASTADVAKGVEQYDLGELAKARELLQPLLNAPDLASTELGRARLYFAASAFALHDQDAARAALVQLFRDLPDAAIDPSVFVPEFVAFSDSVRREVRAKPKGPAYTLVPFGAGQFKNGDTLKGAAFLSAEVLAFATSVASFIWLSTNKSSLGQNSISVGFYDPGAIGTARTLNTVYVAAFWTGVAVAAAGIAEGVYASKSE